MSLSRRPRLWWLLAGVVAAGGCATASEPSGPMFDGETASQEGDEAESASGLGGFSLVNPDDPRSAFGTD